jgi:hypothetical protein
MIELLVQFFVEDRPPLTWSPIDCPAFVRAGAPLCRPQVYPDMASCKAAMSEHMPGILAEGRRRKAVILIGCRAVEGGAERSS